MMKSQYFGKPESVFELKCLFLLLIELTCAHCKKKLENRDK